MAPIVKKAPQTSTVRPRILVVDDEPTLVDLVNDVVGTAIPCTILTAKDVAEAKRIIATQGVEMMIADVNLPDGNGHELVANLKHFQPVSTSIIITGNPSPDGAI